MVNNLLHLAAPPKRRNQKEDNVSCLGLVVVVVLVSGEERTLNESADSLFRGKPFNKLLCLLLSFLAGKRSSFCFHSTGRRPPYTLYQHGVLVKSSN